MSEGHGIECPDHGPMNRVTYGDVLVEVRCGTCGMRPIDLLERLTVSDESASEPVPAALWPRIHLFRFPRRELVLAVGAVASTWLAARYGMSRDEIVLAAVPVVGGWVVSEVVG